MILKKFSLTTLLFSAWIFTGVPATAAPVDASPTNILATLKAGHPRLMVTSTTWDLLKSRRKEDKMLDGLLKRGEADARALLAEPPVVYKMEGKRLLAVSRAALIRIVLLAMQYHLTGDKMLAHRAQVEMLAVADFADWNPSHFLDVAEMTTGLAFGYDWLYDDLDPEARKTIRRAIVEKGLRAGLPDMAWAARENNWNQVCLGGMTVGALAVAEDEPDLAARTLEKTRQYNNYGLKPYAPGGVYPEGGGYWNYGTTYQLLILDSLQSALGTDWGLSKSPGFMESAAAHLQTIGPSGKFFNFADSGENAGIEPAMFWFAKKLGHPEFLQFTMKEMQTYVNGGGKVPGESRMFPFVALWWTPFTPGQGISLPKAMLGLGSNPIATFRSEWNNPKAMYLALKGGMAGSSHGHMDAGSFVFESDGVRWARDMGSQEYYSLESKNIELFDRKQSGDRWRVFRLNNFSHNTLTINKQIHLMSGRAVITRFSDAADAGAVVDLSPVFTGQASRVTRGFVFRAGGHALVRDEVEGLKNGDNVRWAMVTNAEIAISADGSQAILKQEGKELHVSLVSTSPAKFEITSGQPPENGYDAPNPGVQILTATFTAPASGALDWSVILQPGSAADTPVDDKLARTPLSQWPQPMVK